MQRSVFGLTGRNGVDSLGIDHKACGHEQRRERERTDAPSMSNSTYSTTRGIVTAEIKLNQACQNK